MEVKDIIHTGQLSQTTGEIEGGLDFSSGDIKVDWSDDMHVEHIFKSIPGNWYQWPQIGIGIYQEINGNTSSIKLTKKIREHLISDNYRIKQLSIEGEGDEMIVNVDQERIQ